MNITNLKTQNLMVENHKINVGKFIRYLSDIGILDIGGDEGNGIIDLMYEENRIW